MLQIILLLLLAFPLLAQQISSSGGSGGGGSGTTPMQISFNTAMGTCSVTAGGGTSPSCTATTNSVTATHNYGITLPLLPWVVCSQTSTDSILGGAMSSASITDVIGNSANQVTIPLSTNVTGTCQISTGGVGPQGAAGATGATGAAGSNGTNGTNGTGFSPATSTTTYTPASGSETFTVQSGLGFQAGGYVTVSCTASPTTIYAVGSITSYSGTSLVFNVPATGSNWFTGGACSAWTVSPGAYPGQNGSGAGTITSITFSSPLTGGTITASGTVGCSTCVVSVSHKLGVTFVNGGSALSGTSVFCEPIQSTGTIVSVYTTADVSGSATIGIKTVAFASYTGIAGYSGYTDIVNGGTAPSLSSAVKYTDSTLTSWLTSLTGGQMICIQESSPATVTSLGVTLIYTGTT